MPITKVHCNIISKITWKAATVIRLLNSVEFLTFMTDGEKGDYNK